MLTLIKSPLVRQYAVVIIVNLSVFCVGLGLSWVSPVLVKLRDPDNPVLSRPITEQEGSWLVAIGYFLGIFANFVPGFFLDRIGRKYFVLFSAAPKLIVGLLFIFANDVWMLLLARAISGSTDIFIFNAVPIYASEIASVKVRGSLGTIVQIMSSLGSVVMLSMGPFTPYLTLNIIYTAIAVVTFVPLIFLPESPYFLVSKGRTEEAVKVLTFLRGSEDVAREEIAEYYQNKSVETKQESKLSLFKKRTFLRGFGAVCILGMLTQLLGYNAVSSYLQTILETTQTSVSPEIASVIIGIIQLAASICSSILTDRAGRKPILYVTLVGVFLGMIGLGTFFVVTKDTDVIEGFLNFLPLMSLILVIFCFSAGPGSVNWALMAELFDGPARALGMAITSPFAQFIGFLTLIYFARVTAALGPALTYYIFSINSVLLFLFVLFCLPETRGKTFAEIQLALGGKPKPVDEEKTEPTTVKGQ